MSPHTRPPAARRKTRKGLAPLRVHGGHCHRTTRALLDGPNVLPATEPRGFHLSTTELLFILLACRRTQKYLYDEWLGVLPVVPAQTRRYFYTPKTIHIQHPIYLTSNFENEPLSFSKEHTACFIRRNVDTFLLLPLITLTMLRLENCNHEFLLNFKEQTYLPNNETHNIEYLLILILRVQLTCY